MWYLSAINLLLCISFVASHFDTRVWHHETEAYQHLIADIHDDGQTATISVPHSFHQNKFNAQVIPLNSLTELVLTLVTVEVGSRKQKFNLVVDTGSSAVVIPAKDCSGCQVVEGFDIELSRTHTAIPCSLCKCGALCECHPNKRHKQADNCTYQVMFVDGTGANTQLITDIVTMENSTKETNVTLAVMHTEISSKKVHLTTNLTSEGAHIDGVLGLLNTSSYCDNWYYDKPFKEGCRPLNWISALWDTYDLPRRFSLYVGDYNFKKEGILITSNETNPDNWLKTTEWTRDSFAAADNVDTETRYVNLQGGSYYSVNLNGMELQGEEVLSDAGFSFGESIIDSGTNTIVLASAPYKKLKDKFSELYDDLPAVTPTRRGVSLWDRSTCLVADKVDITRFPPITFVFDYNVKLTIPPERYFTLMKDSTSYHLLYCLSILDAVDLDLDEHTTILGQTFMSSFFITFDIEESVVSFQYIPVPTVNHQIQLIMVTTGSILGLVIMVAFFIQQYISIRKTIYSRIRAGMPELRHVMQPTDTSEEEEGEEREVDDEQEEEDTDAPPVDTGEAAPPPPQGTTTVFSV